MLRLFVANKRFKIYWCKYQKIAFSDFKFIFDDIIKLAPSYKNIRIDYDE